MFQLSLLDNGPIAEGMGRREALAQMVNTARRAEALGYHRFWVGEHHQSPSFASMAPTLMLAHLAAVTNKIRLGSGGVMLHNHAPLVVMEQFYTLAALCPERLDLGLGRTGCSDAAADASTTSPPGARGAFEPIGNFDRAFDELKYIMSLALPTLAKSPAAAGKVLPLWMLASGVDGSMFAANGGLPMAIRPTADMASMIDLVKSYRKHFRHSEQQTEQRVMVNVDCVAAETDEEAHYLATSLIQQVRNNVQGRPGALPPPVSQLDAPATPEEAEAVARKMALTLVGGPESLRQQIDCLVKATGADELIVSLWAHDPEARLRGLEVLARAGGLEPRG